jgi:HD-GYP domain-containing protein (c-di-GMP phosphodiesterase class II)
MSTILQELEREGIQVQASPFMSLLRMRHRETGVHSENIRVMVRNISERLSVATTETQTIETAASLHDLGTIAIPDPILHKSGGLSEEERRVMQTHARFGYEALKESAEFQKLAHIVLHHHERFDGTGYPDGIEGKDIPFGSRMISVLDAFEAMTSEQPHRRRMTKREACDELLIGKGAQFDPEIVEALLETLRFGVH